MVEVVIRPTKYSRYYADAHGNIWSCKQRSWKILKKRPGRNKLYDCVHIRSNYQGSVDVHRLVCETFFGPNPKEKPWALHKNGNSRDNSVANLYWGGPQDNSDDRVRHGRSMCGELCKTSTITNAQAAKIKRALRAGLLTQKQIASKYGGNEDIVGCIKRGISWKHVK